MPSTKAYPDNWPQIAAKAKERAGHKCERCNVPDSHNPQDGNCLTVHHLVPDTKLNEDWNLAALCQRCHLHMKKVSLYQGYLFEITGWLAWHIEGFVAWQKNKKKMKCAMFNTEYCTDGCGGQLLGCPKSGTWLKETFGTKHYAGSPNKGWAY